MTTFTDDELAAWAERKRVRSQLKDGRADPETCTYAGENCLAAQIVADPFRSRQDGARRAPAAMLDQVAYGDSVANYGIEAWPNAGHVLLDELRAARGRAALISAAAPAESDDLVDRLGTDLGVEIARLGQALADRPQPPTLADIELVCAGATLITELDVLLWPEMHVAPLQFLSARARHHATIAAWPGTISGGRASYSAPGRPDHVDLALRDVVVLRPRGTSFPDEVPFTIERMIP